MLRIFYGLLQRVPCRRPIHAPFQSMRPSASCVNTMQTSGNRYANRRRCPPAMALRGGVTKTEKSWSKMPGATNTLLLNFSRNLDMATCYHRLADLHCIRICWRNGVLLNFSRSGNILTCYHRLAAGILSGMYTGRRNGFVLAVSCCIYTAESFTGLLSWLGFYLMGT